LQADPEPRRRWILALRPEAGPRRDERRARGRTAHLPPPARRPRRLARPHRRTGHGRREPAQGQRGRGEAALARLPRIKAGFVRGLTAAGWLGWNMDVAPSVVGTALREKGWRERALTEQAETPGRSDSSKREQDRAATPHDGG